jgi:acetyl esterase/lipase
MKNVIVITILLALKITGNAQKTFAIWSGPAPGSESWTWQTQVDSSSMPGDPLTYNIVQPVLLFFPADPTIANGTGVIICPGGSFCYLHTKTEGSDVAEWLNKKGVSAFVLLYRVVHSETTHPMQEKTDRSKDTARSRQLLTPIVPMAIADGKQALLYTRQHARDFGLSPDRIGIIGFSAGGTLATATAFDYNSDNKPDFVAPIYPYVPPNMQMTMKSDAPPLFVAAATDDEYHLVPMSIALYSKWLSTGHSAELHIYSKGGHGFGMNKQHQPSDTWIQRWGDWLQLQGFLNK